MRTALYVPPDLVPAKRRVFKVISPAFDFLIDGDLERLESLPREVVPVVSCRQGIGRLVRKWRREGREFIYWDRGYINRGGRTWLGFGDTWRIHRNATQMPDIRPSDGVRLRALNVPLRDWNRNGRHVLVADHGPGYQDFNRCRGWLRRTVARLKQATDRPVVVRKKESRIPLYDAVADAHCLVTHGSNAAVEAAIFGCPVFVDPVSAASPIGRTDLDIENPIYPDRWPWLASLADGQFTTQEIKSGLALSSL